MRNCIPKCSYLRTPMGAVKLANVVIGGLSLILVAVSYVPVWTLAIFVGTVAGCLCLSSLYILFHLTASVAIVQSKANRVTSFLFHVLAGTALVVAGIELIGWSDYDKTCKDNCPHLYTVGIAKTLTFMNGTLYLIVGFLGLKDDDMLDSNEAEEDIPLLNSNDILTSIPGKVMSSSLHGSHSHSHYDPFHRAKAPLFFDDARAHYYFSRQNQLHHPNNLPHSENVLAQSYNSMGGYNGIQYNAPQPYYHYHGGRGHTRTSSMSSTRSVHENCPLTTVSPDLDLIKE